MSPKSHDQRPALKQGSKVNLRYLGQEVTGSVIEDRGPLGHNGRRLLAVQLDGSPSQPFELETEETDLTPGATMSVERQSALESFIDGANDRQRFIIGAALRMFRDELRHVAAGLWPDHLAGAVSRGTEGQLNPGIDEVTEVLDRLAGLGVVVRRPSGLFVSTDWFLEYLDETSFQAEWSSEGVDVRQAQG